MGKESQKKARREDQGSGDSPEQESRSKQRDVEIPAIRHIGRTLESDPEYYAVATPGYSTPEAQIAAEAGPIDVDQRRMEEDDFDPLSGRTPEDRPEPLKTHLPGDTSSDPHTDLGPDNATSLQHRDERTEERERKTA